MDLYRKGIVAFDHIEELLLLLLQVARLAIEMFDDLRRAIDSNQSGDVVEGRIGGQQSRIWRSEELFVDSLE